MDARIKFDFSLHFGPCYWYLTFIFRFSFSLCQDLSISLLLFMPFPIQAIVTRKNSLTGIHYFDEPAIFAWELMNEPRCSSNSSSSILQVNLKPCFDFLCAIVHFQSLLGMTEVTTKRERLYKDMSYLFIWLYLQKDE